MHRFFVTPESIERGTVVFSSSQSHQILNVLRMRVGDQIVVLDNSGWQYDAELVAGQSGQALAKVRTRALVTTEPRTKITLYQSLLKSDHFELVLQKCAEIGVASIVPTISDRCVASSIPQEKSGRLDRWRRILLEAAEQSGRGKLPTLGAATMFPQAIEAARGMSLVPWEGERESRLRDVLRGASPKPFSINLFVGPEGGYSDDEIQEARAYGAVPVTLGARILRAETAAIAASAMILYELGDAG